MVVTLDVGENHDIHPSNKHDVGNRFALLALNRTYDKDFIDSGPELDNIEQEGRYLNVYFKNCDSGLMPINNKNTSFEIAGSNKVYFDAEVNVYKKLIQLSSKELTDPKYVRYAWSDTASATLFNNAGLPGSPFSSEHLNYFKSN
jgi:sialate O-acetylesterase